MATRMWTDAEVAELGFAIARDCLGLVTVPDKMVPKIKLLVAVSMQDFLDDAGAPASDEDIAANARDDRPS